MREYVALLRAIAHVPMLPFRQALEELGFWDVASYGMSGNLLFNAEGSDIADFEDRISKRLSAVTMIRTREEIETIVTSNPFLGGSAAIMFLGRAVDERGMSEFEQVDFEGDRPQIVGRTVYFVHPARPRGRRTGIDFERMLKVPGTARSAAVVSEILKRMSESP